MTNPSNRARDATKCATSGCRRDYEVIVACAPDGFLCRNCADALVDAS